MDSRLPIVEITYCGGWGYGSRFSAVQKQLKSNPEIGYAINVVGKRESTSTGNFIFTFQEKTIWSKKENGDKFPDDADISKIVEEIKSGLSTKSW